MFRCHGCAERLSYMYADDKCLWCYCKDNYEQFRQQQLKEMEEQLPIELKLNNEL